MLPTTGTDKLKKKTIPRRHTINSMCKLQNFSSQTVKFTLAEAAKAHKGSTGTVLLFL
jgi:hypothetical protein